MRKWTGAGIALLSLLAFIFAPLFAEARPPEQALSTAFAVFLVHLVPALGGTALTITGFFTSDDN
ncbi:hypothetical protein [Halobacillus litoralis]|uniref:hypothetical protein n=1 Tax=Halobacillus litoralis TaxID=45668 RepID=UPI001CD62281|nr:hypothetical protein [Halobacillus litoralis]MCA1022439.1 hypothetical protein [Halobacillus litoralis]